MTGELTEETPDEIPDEFNEHLPPEALDAIFKHVTDKDREVRRYRLIVIVLVPVVVMLVAIILFFVVYKVDQDRSNRRGNCRSDAFAAKFDNVIDALPLGATDKERTDALRGLKNGDSLALAYDKCNKLP